MSETPLARRFSAVVSEVGAATRVIVATKYVADDDLAALIEAGATRVGENRLQDLERKHDRYGSAFEWHFIGQLQSRKAPSVSERVELVHSLSSLSAARKLTVPALIQVNLAGEESKAGVTPDDLPRFLEEARDAGTDVVGLSTMPPLATLPEASRSYFRQLADLARKLGLSELSMGTSQDYQVAAEEGATYVRVGSVLFDG